jgi:hypothetical protein
MKSVGFKDLKIMNELEGKNIIAVATKKVSDYEDKNRDNRGFPCTLF